MRGRGKPREIHVYSVKEVWGKPGAMEKLDEPWMKNVETSAGGAARTNPITVCARDVLMLLQDKRTRYYCVLLHVGGSSQGWEPAGECAIFGARGAWGSSSSSGVGFMARRDF